METEKISIAEITAGNLLKAMMKRKELNRIDYLKCKLGLEVVFINLTKLFVIYFLASILNIVMPVFILNLSFLFIRIHGHGAHSMSSKGCTILSCLIFIGSAILISYLPLMPKVVIGIVHICDLYIAGKYAPGSTKKNPIKNEEKRQRLRKKTIVHVIILFFISIICPSLFVSNLITLGCTIACILLLPNINRYLEKEI